MSAAENNHAAPEVEARGEGGSADRGGSRERAPTVGIKFKSRDGLLRLTRAPTETGPAPPEMPQFCGRRFATLAGVTREGALPKRAVT
jgi:hypothetical protein